MTFCYSCQQTKAESDFRKLKSGKPTEWCTDCISNYSIKERKQRKIKYIHSIIKNIAKEV